MSIHGDIKDFYDHTAKQSFKDWFNNNTLLPVLKYFVSKMPAKPRILDLGCGIGGEAKRLSGLNASVIGIDISEKCLEIARKNVPKVEFRNMDILFMKFNLHAFEGILDAGTLFHFNAVEQNKILRNVIKILTKTGVLLSFYPVGNKEGIQEIKIGEKIYRRYRRFISMKDWREQVLQAGFKRCEPVDFKYENFKTTIFYK